ncbi:hypothetical protein AB1Y20_018375 [Prymnesium parvum]|uniref:Uncharacterized protein n=1 Tax=Prymnesium parvum TaxID=97485 RepID=A0AB34JRR1_PRYPA
MVLEGVGSLAAAETVGLLAEAEAEPPEGLTEGHAAGQAAGQAAEQMVALKVAEGAGKTEAVVKEEQ